jgi:hypothetical protein
MNLSFWEMTEIIIKCGRQICQHLYCLFRLQRIQNKVLDMSVVSSLIGSLINEIMCSECDGSSGLVRDSPHICVE